MATNAYIRGVKERGWQPFNRRLFQRNYYEHIIRNDRELAGIRAYIETTPARWMGDIDNLDNRRPFYSPDTIHSYLRDVGILWSPAVCHR